MSDNSLYSGVDYSLIEDVIKFIHELSNETDVDDAVARVYTRKLAEAVGLPLSKFRLLKEDKIKPLYRKDYVESKDLSESDKLTPTGKNKRPVITEDTLNEVCKEQLVELHRRLESKGYGSFASIHEGFGVISEEVNKELLDDIHANNHAGIYKELLDVEVACIFFRACLKQGTLDW